MNIFNKNYIINMDAPSPWGTYFQDSASPQMEGLIELHDSIMFYLVICRTISIPIVLHRDRCNSKVRVCRMSGYNGFYGVTLQVHYQWN